MEKINRVVYMSPIFILEALSVVLVELLLI